MLSQGVNLSELGVVRDYSNHNISILLYLIPAIAYPNEVSAIHEDYKNQNVNEYSVSIALEYGLLYEKYMNEEIFPKILEPTSITCRPEIDLASDEYAKYYSSKDDPVGATNGVSADSFCRPQGSWHMTAQELAHFARTYAFTNNYIGPTTKEALHNDPSNSNDLLLYSRLIDHGGFAEELGQEKWAFHGGDQKEYHTALIRLPYDHYGVGMVNSKEVSSGGIARAIIDSFYEATRGQPPIVDVGGPYNGNEGSYTLINGASATDPDGDSLSYAWSSTNNSCLISNPNSLNTSIRCSNDSAYQITLEVNDGKNTVSDSATLTVNNVPPEISLNGPSNANEGDTQKL